MLKSEIARGVAAIAASLLIHVLLVSAISVLISGYRLDGEMPRSALGRSSIHATLKQALPITSDAGRGGANASAEEGGRSWGIGGLLSPAPQWEPLVPLNQTRQPNLEREAPVTENLAIVRDYASAKDLTKQPSLIGQFPDVSVPWARNSTGSVVVDVYIDEHGVVQDVKVVDHFNMPRYLPGRVASWFRAMRFTPGEMESVHVASRIRVELTFGDDDARMSE